MWFDLPLDGLITRPRGDLKLSPYLRRFKVPTVAIGVHEKKFGDVRVTDDEEAVGPAAVEHFIGRGLEHIGFVEYWGTGIEYRRRLILQEAVARSRCAFHLLDGNKLPAQLRHIPKPVGLTGAGDEAMMNVMQVCLKEGYRIPNEIALLGVDDIEFVCETAPVSLSSINLDFERMGYEAAAQLDRLMRGESPPKHPVVVPIRGLTVRKSTNLLAFSNQRLAKAARYIQEHFHEPITVADVVRLSGISRPVLQRLFRYDIGRSILDVIRQSRVEKAKQMLLNTDCKVDVVAEQCGFTNRLHFHRTFSRSVGAPPARWRQERRV